MLVAPLFYDKYVVRANACKILLTRIVLKAKTDLVEQTHCCKMKYIKRPK